MRTYLLIFSIIVAWYGMFAATPAYAARSLYIGLSGSDVTALQIELISRGYLAAGKSTGYYGPLTEAAVQKFQCESGVVCAGGQGYGVYGPKTQATFSTPLTSDALRKHPSVSITGKSLTGPATGSFEVSGWIPYWRAATGTADVLPHLSTLKSVMPFGYTVTDDGYLYDEARLAGEPWVSFMNEARKQNVRVVPTIMWGDGQAIHATLSNDAKRAQLIKDIVKVSYDYNFDGIDIDFEAKLHETMPYFSQFLKELYPKMGNKFVYCTVESRMPLEDRYLKDATIPSDVLQFANDFDVLNKYCDRVVIMAYDQGTVDVRLNLARFAPYAPVADPGWAENVIRLAAQSISKNKLILGIPTYGYEYTVTPQNGTFKYKRLWPFNYRYATDIATRLGVIPERNSAGELGFSYDPSLLATAPSGDEITQTQQNLPSESVAQNAGSGVSFNQPFNFVSWSDASAIKDKVDLAHRLGLRGVAVFKFDGGEDQGMWSVLK